MSNFHDKLMLGSNGYRNWHNHPHHVFWHWVGFLGATIFIFSAVTGALNGYLTDYGRFELGQARAANLTYYIGPGGSDSNPGTNSLPFATFIKAFSAMAAGDVLILKDGIYNQILSNPPSGTVLAYTIVRAENDGKAIIDGGGRGGALSIDGRSYIQLEGLRVTNGYDDGVSINRSNHIKILRFEIPSGPSPANAYGSAMDIDNSSYILVEDSQVWGTFRYGFQVYGWTAGTGNSKIIFRRNVCRWDAMITDQPIACFMVYGHSDYLNTQDILYQNNIALDFNNPAKSPQNAFSSDKIWQNVKYYGNIALNLGSNWLAFAGSGYGGSGNKYYENNIADGSGTAFRATGVNYTVNQATVISAAAGLETYGEGLYKNSFFLNSGANINGFGSYSDFYNTPLQSGTGNRTNNPNLVYLPRSTDSGTGEGGAKRGATIEKRYGISGTLWGDAGYDQLTSEPLWPWPNEARIKTDMCQNTSRGFCAAGSLTNYIWGYLGSSCPSDICTAGNIIVVATATPTPTPTSTQINAPTPTPTMAAIITPTPTPTPILPTPTPVKTPTPNPVQTIPAPTPTSVIPSQTPIQTTQATPTPTATPSPIQDPTILSLSGQYYISMARNKFANLIFTRDDSLIDFDWGNGSPDGLPRDNFGIRWSEILSFPQTGTYTLQTISDDGIRVWLDGVLILNRWYDHKTTRYNVTRQISQGNHALTVEYYEHHGRAVAKAAWKAKSITIESESKYFSFIGKIADYLFVKLIVH